MGKETIKLDDEIDSLIAENNDLRDKIAKGFNEAAETLLSKLTAELKAKDEEIVIEFEKFQAELKAKDAEIERLRPRPLLFGKLDEFKVIVCEYVPEGQIWFATQEQIGEALEYSRQQIEKALKGE